MDPPSSPDPPGPKLPTEVDMLLPLSIEEPLARSGSNREGLGGGEHEEDERGLRSRHTRQKMAYWSYSFAAECFASAGMSAFIPLTLEASARSQGFSDSARTVPCRSSSDGGSGESCKALLLGTVWIESSSFALYTFSIAVLVQALSVISLSTIADRPSQRKRLLLAFALVGSLSALLYPVVTSASILALLAVVGITSFGISFVCLNSYLPDLGRGGVNVRAAKRRVDEEVERVAAGRQRVGGGVGGADDRPGLMLPGVEFASGSERVGEEGAPLLEDEVLSHQVNDGRLEFLRQAHFASLSTYTSSVSLFGSAIGYGGGVLLYIPCFLLVTAMKGSTFSLRLSVGLSGAMWLIASTPALLWLGGIRGVQEGKGKIRWRKEVGRSWRNLGRMLRWSEIKRLSNLFWFLFAWFFLSDACATFSSTSIIFAKTTLGMKSSQVTIVACIAQATGVLGGFASPTLQRRLGWSNLLSMCALVGVLASICLYGCLGLIGGKEGFGGLRTPGEMYAVAGVFGLAFGPFQAFARSVFSEIIPPGQEARWFGLYSITDKSSSFFGPAVVGLITDLTGEIRYGFIFLFLVLALPIPILRWKVDVGRGREEAEEYAETAVQEGD